MSPPLLQITPPMSPMRPRPVPQASRPPVPGEPGPGSVLTRTVIASDGQAYLLQTRWTRASPRRACARSPPGSTFPAHALDWRPGGLLFSILFAWHLTRPMNALRRS